LHGNFRKAGYKGIPTLSYHIYQFNIHEIKSARDFCSSKGLFFVPYIAYINDFNLAMAYLDGTMDYKLLERASKELLLYYVDNHIRDMPKDYYCPQFDILTIDESCNVLTCCCISKNHPDYSIGSLFDLSSDEIYKKKVSQDICIKCINIGLAYWAHNPYHFPPFVHDLIGTSLPKKIYRNRKLLIKSLTLNKLYNFWKFRRIYPRL
jgi:hypothetical protein